MFEVSEEKMAQIIKLLDRSDFAINTLERANNNRMLFTDLKSEVQKLSEELKSRYPKSINL